MDKQRADRLCQFAKGYFVEVFTSVMLSHTELELQEDLTGASLNTAAPEHCCLGDSRSLELCIQVL